MRALQHRREINKKTRAGDKKLKRQLKNAQKVGSFATPAISTYLFSAEGAQQSKPKT